MSIHSLVDRRERRRTAAEAVYADVERQVNEARDRIMNAAMDRLRRADGHATIDAVGERLGRIWSEAWPFAQGDAE